MCVYLGLEHFCVHAMTGLEDLLCFLLGPEKRRSHKYTHTHPLTCSHPTHTRSLAELFPALEEVCGGHLCGLEELVDGDRQLERDILQGSPIPERNTHTLLNKLKITTTKNVCVYV